MPDITREICNAWKSDRTLASFVLSSRLGQAACELAGWPSARIGQDDIWQKPPGGREVAFHQDAPYISRQFVPRANNSVTAWLALDDVSAEVGTLEYVPRSHR